jgi:3-methyladenine DNA glycosylase AlkD
MAPRHAAQNVDTVVASLNRLATKRTRDGLARYGIPSDNALGVTIGAIQKVAKPIGRDHDLAEALWQTEWYEARLLAAFVDDPERVTPAQMDRWCQDFDNWGICDTVYVAAVAVSRRLAGSPDAAAKWVGKDALRQLTSPVTTRRLAAKARTTSRRKDSAKAL